MTLTVSVLVAVVLVVGGPMMLVLMLIFSIRTVAANQREAVEPDQAANRWCYKVNVREAYHSQS